MRLLPILWAEAPSREDWARLTRARELTGYTEKIQPANAYPGSPGPILAVGRTPDWLTGYAYVESTEDSEGLVAALNRCLFGEESRAEEYERLLSAWMGEEITYAGEEEMEDG